jgi:HD superfamily phosphohydrolase
VKKKHFDPVHKFIDLDAHESLLLNTLPLKRLNAIHQIGSAAFVYGGGDHKRFDHSLGTMFVVTKIFDSVVKKIPSLMSAELLLDAKTIRYWRKVLRAAALCHDVGHPPFSHLAEEVLLGEKGHEKWTMNIIRSDYLLPIWKKGGVEVEHIVKVAVGEKLYGEKFTPWEKVVTEMLTGDFFGGDRIDYLLRDSYFTGLAYGSFDYLQLIDCIRILPKGKEVVLGVEEDGLESCYALLLARYFMHKRLYQYPNVKSYSFHLKEFIKIYFEGKSFLDSVDQYLRVNDYEILSEINKAQFDPKHPGFEHAQALMDQCQRIEVRSISDEEFKKLSLNISLAPSSYFFEKNPLALKKEGLSFPVLMKNDIVVQAQDISDIHIPVYNKNWLYIQPGALCPLDTKANDEIIYHSTD